MRFRIDLKILIFFVIFFITNQLQLYLWMLVFCFIHELGHLLAGMTMGLKPEKVELMPFGFFMNFQEDTQKGYKEIIKTNILVALAGPITTLIIIILYWNLNIPFISRDIAIYANLAILTLNLLPVYPLDGGRIVQNILELIYGKYKATIYMNKISNIYMIIITVAGSIAIYYFKNIAILLIIIYLWILVIKENENFRMQMKVWNYMRKYNISR